ncbi:MAG: twin-arginine translocation signal domain-containing protein [Acidimicrobiales bacterium]
MATGVLDGHRSNRYRSSRCPAVDVRTAEPAKTSTTRRKFLGAIGIGAGLAAAGVPAVALARDRRGGDSRGGGSRDPMSVR